MTPALDSYDVLLLNTSGGKDSQAMLDYVVELADTAGVRDRVVAVHADLGRVEWPGTREIAAEQVAHYGLRFEVVSRTQGDLLQQIAERGMFPDAARRYCTSDQKRGPITKLITRLVTERRDAGHPGPVRVLNLMGLRAEESRARSLRAPFSRNERATNGRRVVDEWLPIHGWTLEQVWARIDAAGTPVHPAYGLGMPRLSCRFCILASKSALVLAARHNPELAAEYVELEERIGHRFRNDLTMREVVDMAASVDADPTVEGWAA